MQPATPTTTAPQSAPFNGGAPLSPQQVQSLRAQIGITPAASGTTASTGGSSAWAAYDSKISKIPAPSATEKPGSPGSEFPETGAIPDIVNGAKNAIEQGGQNVVKDVTNIPAEAQKAGGGAAGGAGGLPADLAAEAAGAGHVAGDIAGTAGGIIGSVITPFLPDPVKQKIGDVTKFVTDKVNSIPGMTPEIAKSLGDVFNALSLEGGAKGAPVVKDAAATTAEAGVNTAKAAGETVGDMASAAAKGVTNKLSDAATSITPNMETLIKRVESDPKLAAKTAADVQKYFKVANDAKGVTGAPTPLDLAGGQFKTAMAKLRANMNDAGQTMSSSLKPIANTNVSGVGDILKHLQDQTAERLGSVYTPLAEDIKPMEGMNFAQRTKFLNDVLDGKTSNPFSEGEGPLQAAPGRKSLVSSPGDIKKIADLHETLSDLGSSPSIQQVHDVVKRWQQDLYKSSKPGAEPIDSGVVGLMKETIGKLNSASKDASLQAEKNTGLTPGAYADAKAKYGQLADLHSDMSHRLGDKYIYASSMIKKIFSPQNNGLNEDIRRLETHTGVPIFDHATLADFAMRSINDPRMRSLLEDAPLTPSKRAWAQQLFSYIKDKLADPEGKALRQLAPKAEGSLRKK